MKPQLGGLPFGAVDDMQWNDPGTWHDGTWQGPVTIPATPYDSYHSSDMPRVQQANASTAAHIQTKGQTNVNFSHGAVAHLSSGGRVCVWSFSYMTKDKYCRLLYMYVATGRFRSVQKRTGVYRTCGTWYLVGSTAPRIFNVCTLYANANRPFAECTVYKIAQMQLSLGFLEHGPAWSRWYRFHGMGSPAWGSEVGMQDAVQPQHRTFESYLALETRARWLIWGVYRLVWYIPGTYICIRTY